MKRRFAILVLGLALAPLFSACAPLLDLAGPTLFNQAGRQACEPARADDPAAPGEWLCPTSMGERALPRHRVARRTD